MKSPTEPYRKLKSTLREVSTILSRVPHLACDNRLHNLKVQSYILLSHAALEEYLESLSRQISEMSVKLFNDQGLITKALVSMTAYETIAQIDEEISRKKIKLELANNFSTFVNAAKINLHKKIDDNHGIRMDNQRSLLVPIGVDPEQCDLPTFNALDAFGRKRGAIAHKVIINREDTKSSAFSEIKVISQGLLEYDKSACESLALRMKY